VGIAPARPVRVGKINDAQCLRGEIRNMILPTLRIAWAYLSLRAKLTGLSDD
jgi:hypothetical protein